MPRTSLLMLSDLLLLAARLLSTLPLTLGINLGGEGAGEIAVSLDQTNSVIRGYILLPLQGEPVQHKDLGCQKETGNLALVQSNSEEVQSAAPVHGGAGHVEWEAGNRGIHEDTKVVTKIGASHAQS